LLSSEPYRYPRLREAATTLTASGGQRSEHLEGRKKYKQFNRNEL